MPAMSMSKTAFLLKLILAAFLLFPPTQQAAASDPQTVEIWKDPSCGCCQAWADHLKAAGFDVSIHESDDMNGVKAMNRVPSELASCHTAKTGGYVIEGHVPAADIMRLLKEKPKVHGLAVPGMPLGSPGMEMPDGETEAYDVMSFDEGGNAAVWSSHNN
jgi:hypothetical protein